MERQQPALNFCQTGSKVIDLKKSIYQLSKQYPEIVNIMKELGFDRILEPGMLETVGRFMTIPKGAAMKGFDLNQIREAFITRGYIFQE